MSATQTALNGIERNIDDFRSRKKLKQLFHSKGITVFEGDELPEICDKYIIDMRVL